MGIVPPLPLDVFYLIIDTIHSTGNPGNLQSLSLASKNLCLLARTRMFRKLSLDLPKMKQIYNYIGDGSQQPLPTVLSSVRNLHVQALEASPSQAGRKYLEVLRFFTHVIHLRIYNWHFQDFDKHHVTHLLGHFGTSVTQLKLLKSYFNSEVLIFITSLFPLVDHLRVIPQALSELETYKIQDADLSRDVGFRGMLGLGYLNKLQDQFLEFVSKNCSFVHAISVIHCESDGKLQGLIDHMGGNLLCVNVGVAVGGGEFFSSLKIPTSLPMILTSCVQGPISLSSCVNLKSLHIGLNGLFSPDDANWKILGTITSPRLESILIYNFSGITEHPLVEWKEINDFLCRYCLRICAVKFRIYLRPDANQSDDYHRWFADYLSRAFSRFMEKTGSIMVL